MEFKSYTCPSCKKHVKSTSGLTRYINICKIPIILPSYQSSILALILDYNTTNHLDLPSNNFEKNISPGTSNNGKKRIRLVDKNNNKKDIRPADIDK